MKSFKIGSNILNDVVVRRTLFFLIALVVVGIRLLQTLSFDRIPEISNFTYSCILMISLGVIILFSPQVRINRILAAFVLIGGLSLLSAQVVIENPAYQRLAFFALLLMLLSPIVTSRALSELRMMMWRILMGGLRGIIVISFAMYFSWEANRTTEVMFEGCTGHGMQLAVIGVVVILDGIWHLMCRPEVSRLKAMIYGVVTAMAVIVTIAAGSRGALLAVMTGCVPLVWYVRHSKIKLWGFVVAVALLIGVSAVMSFRNFAGVKYKTDLSAQCGSITFSRNFLWQARIDEFCERPLLGIGFSVATDRQLPENYKNTPFEDCSTIEPGSSWLNVLASTGIVGFILMLWFNVKLMKTTIKRVSANRRNILYMSLLLALWIHGCIEGWVLYAGSMTFMIYWLLTSRFLDLSGRSSNN